MIRLIYNMLISVVERLMGFFGLINPKINQGAEGRSKTFAILREKIKPTDKVIWMHVASLGEFEQGRPVLEKLKLDFSNHLILLSFFSPSGYEIRKNYEHADVICYLPLDTKLFADRFMELAHPDLVIFVKYEFWPNYLAAIQQSNAKSILISTVVQKNNALLKYQRKWFVEMLSTFDYILTQDQSTYDLLKNINVRSSIEVAGDTRIDRTLQIAKSSTTIAEVEKFCGDHPVLVAGSTWPADEKLLADLYREDRFQDWILIIAPHDISESHVMHIQHQFDDSIRYSQIQEVDDVSGSRVLVIDNIGLLNRLYQFGRIAYIGGGFGSGIHNTLEPAAFGLPVIFGPKYEKFVEAMTLVATGGAFEINNSEELIESFVSLKNDSSDASKSVNQFMEENRGATDLVMESISQLIE